MAKSHFLSHTTKQSSRYRVALRVQSSVMKRLGLYHCAFSEMEKAHCNKRCEKAKELNTFQKYASRRLNTIEVLKGREDCADINIVLKLIVTTTFSGPRRNHSSVYKNCFQVMFIKRQEFV